MVSSTMFVDNQFCFSQTMDSVFQEMLCEDSGEFSNFCRMSPLEFNYLLSKIEPIITKKTTKWRIPIPAKVRLAITLRFLATGDSYRSLHYMFKISSSLISKIIKEVCQAINIVLKEEIKVCIQYFKSNFNSVILKLDVLN